MAAIDWQYTAPRLRVGGLLMLDDVDLWTGAMICDFLDGEAGWQSQGRLRGRTAVYRKTAPFSAHEWTKQPTVVRKSFVPQTLRKLTNGIGLLASGKLGAIAGKIANERRLALAARNDY